MNHLSCEYTVNPLGIDIPMPRLSWNISSVGRNEWQAAYEIIISDNLRDIGRMNGNMWQTGKVQSNQNIHVVYGGIKLHPFTKYFWRVRVYDKKNAVSDWSVSATFETAALDKADWQAKWIGDGSKQFEKDEDFYQKDPMPLFRRKLLIAKKIASARIYLSGLGYSELYVNGKKIGSSILDPGFTSYRKQVLYVTYDITQHLANQPMNTIGIMLGNGWYNALPLRLFGRFNIRNVQQTGRPCLIAQVLLIYTDGSRQTVATDDQWEAAPGPVIRNNVYLGEQYDARREKSFDTSGEWKKASLASGPDGLLTAQMQPPVRVTRIVKPISIIEAGKDTFVVDMGQNFAGVAKIKVQGKSGTTVSLRYGELVYPNGSLNWITTTAGHIKEIWKMNGGPGAPKTAWQKDDYTLKGQGVEVWNPRFTFHGFRYVEITGWPGRPALADIEGLRMNSDVDLQGNFSCSNEMFNRLHEKIQWTFLSNIFSIQSDCPAREKMGYGADIVATAGAYIHNYNMANFYKKTILDFANEQQPDGALTEIAPYTGIADRGYGGESGPLGWQLAFAYLQKQLYNYYDDTRIIASQYPVLQKQLEFLQAKAVNGLYTWDIGDHEALGLRAEGLTASSFYFHHAKLASEFAGILDKQEDSVTYARLANTIKDSIVSKYLTSPASQVNNFIQAALIFTLWYNISPEPKQTLDMLMKAFETKNWHLTTGIFSTMMMFDVLREHNLNDIAYKIANQRDFPGWGYMLDNGGTTLWESWAKPTSSSMNHPMFGSVDEWFYKSLLGINAAAPGFKKIVLKPQPAELEWAKGSYQSIYGLISSDWKKTTNSFQWKIEIPANTSAEVWIPSNEKDQIRESGKPISAAGDITFIRYDNGYAVFNTGSGTYAYEVNSDVQKR
ncbi:MAG: family 78 glycoside hydrolase catalytic domain [Bacteroidota bacterium]